MSKFRSASVTQATAFIGGFGSSPQVYTLSLPAGMVNGDILLMFYMGNGSSAFGAVNYTFSNGLPGGTMGGLTNGTHLHPVMAVTWNSGTYGATGTITLSGGTSQTMYHPTMVFVALKNMTLGSYTPNGTNVLSSTASNPNTYTLPANTTPRTPPRTIIALEGGIAPAATDFASAGLGVGDEKFGYEYTGSINRHKVKVVEYTNTALTDSPAFSTTVTRTSGSGSINAVVAYWSPYTTDTADAGVNPDGGGASTILRHPPKTSFEDLPYQLHTRMT